MKLLWMASIKGKYIYVAQKARRCDTGQYHASQARGGILTEKRVTMLEHA